MNGSTLIRIAFGWMLVWSSVGMASQSPTPFVLGEWCEAVFQETRQIGWKLSHCPKIEPKVLGHSVEGRPLLVWVFGEEHAKNTTLVFSMVHPDEINPLYLGLKLLEWFEITPIEKRPKGRVVVAPLVNPDAFFGEPKTRTNSRGVDLNRNLPTADWKANALLAWRNQYRSNPRRFPGKEANSEPETVFQAHLIEEFKPQKILSIHAPLGYLDYDGPNTLALSRFSKQTVQRSLQLKKKLNAISGGFFPGSLGNYAGQERGLPTITLELPTAKPELAKAYWVDFRSKMNTLFSFEVPRPGEVP